MVFDFKSALLAYSQSGFMFFSLPGLGLGLLTSGLYELGAGSILFGALSYSISKEFWDRVIYDSKYQKIRNHFFASNIFCYLLGCGYFIFAIALIYYLFYFAFDNLFKRVMSDKKD